MKIRHAARKPKCSIKLGQFCYIVTHLVVTAVCAQLGVNLPPHWQRHPCTSEIMLGQSRMLTKDSRYKRQGYAGGQSYWEPLHVNSGSPRKARGSRNKVEILSCQPAMVRTADITWCIMLEPTWRERFCSNSVSSSCGFNVSISIHSRCSISLSNICIASGSSLDLHCCSTLQACNRNHCTSPCFSIKRATVGLKPVLLYLVHQLMKPCKQGYACTVDQLAQSTLH